MQEIPGFSFTLEAGEDLSEHLFRFVNISGGKAVAATAALNTIGALNNKPQEGEASTIVHGGVAQIEAGAEIDIASGGADVTAVEVGTDGKAVPLAAGIAVGIPLKSASGDGSIIPVLLIQNAA